VAAMSSTAARRRRNRRYPDHVPFVVKRGRRQPPVISIKELRWNARIGVVTQLVYLLGKLPRRQRRLAGIAALGAAWFAFELVVTYWPYLLAGLVVLVAVRRGGPWLEARRQRARDTAEAVEVLTVEPDEPRHDDIPY